MDRITSFPWDFVLIGKMLGTLSHWKHSITERNSPPLQNIMILHRCIMYVKPWNYLSFKTGKNLLLINLSTFPLSYMSSSGSPNMLLILSISKYFMWHLCITIIANRMLMANDFDNVLWLLFKQTKQPISICDKQ